MIIDSGNRTEFSTGAVRDIQIGKGRCDLLPLDVISSLFGKIGDRTSEMIYLFLSQFVGDGNTDHLLDILHVCVPKLFEDYETMTIEVSKHFEEGCVKYGENNWQKGINAHCYVNSAVRHHLKHLRGDTDERHDRAFVWNIMCAVWTCEHLPELNDYKRGEKL